ncbi:MAG: hypothetical protein PHH08_00205 [Candidatus ainarchaeum sp.]|nr:hypothetical protein [Candidatus ainarchaeum sp.]
MARKPIRRKEERLVLSGFRQVDLERARADHMTKFPEKRVSYHADKIRKALIAKRVDWKEIDKSISYFELFLSRVIEVNKKWAKSLRSKIRAGLKISPKEEGSIRRVKVIQDRFVSVLARIKARRKKELGY